MPEMTPTDSAPPSGGVPTDEEGKYVYCIIKTEDDDDFGAIGIGGVTVEARIVVAAIDTYRKYAEAVGTLPSVSRPQALSSGDSAEFDRVRAENIELRRRLEETE